jgi:hypothetical protein
MATNILSDEDSSFEGGTTGGWANMTNAQLANRAGLGYSGTHCLQYWPVNTGQVQIESPRAGVSTNVYYSYSAWVRSAQFLRSVTMYAAYYDSSNNYLSSSDQVASAERSGQWVELLVQDIVPTGAATVRVIITISSAASNEVHYVDSISVAAGAGIPSTGAGAGFVGQQLFQISTGGIMLDLSPSNTWNNGIALHTKDLGGPTVREIIYDHSQMDGSDDLTKFFSQRIVNLVGTCFPVGNQSRSIAWERLAPFLAPGLRCTISYAIDVDVGPRMLTNVRLSSVSRTQDSPITYAFQLQFAADPIAQAVTSTKADIVSLSGGAGRTYPRKYGLMYPSKYGNVAVYSAGILSAWPTYTIYGATNNPTIALTDVDGEPLQQINLNMSIPGGQSVVINSKARSIIMNGNQDVYSKLDLTQSSWGAIRPGTNFLKYTASSLSVASHCAVEWHDSFLY